MDRKDYLSLESLLGERYSLVSRTHHMVYRSADSALYLKVPIQWNPTAEEQLNREYKANMILGRESMERGVLEIGEHRGSTYLLSPSYGETPSRWDSEMVERALDYVNRLPLMAEPVSSIPEGDEWPSLVLTSIKNRGSSVPMGDTLTVDYSGLRGTRLVHRDPHIGNWLVNGAGEASLIDWEGAVRGSVDIVRTVMIYGIALRFPKKEAKALCKPIIRGIEDEDAVRAALNLKAVSAASWAEWAGLGKNEVELRFTTAKNAIALL